jgi:MYXO-CTERM domain-containing protein
MLAAIVVAAVGLVWASDASAVTVLPDADLTLKGGTPGTNFGTGDLIIGSGGGGAADVNRALIHFDMTGQPLADPGFARKLNLTMTAATGLAGQQLSFYKVDPSNTGYGELLATWNFKDGVSVAWGGGAGLGAPGGGGIPAGNVDDFSFGSDALLTMNLDVPTALINDWVNNPGNNAGFLLKLTTETGTEIHNFSLGSREGASGPTLTYTGIPEPSALSLLALGGLAALRRRR